MVGPLQTQDMNPTIAPLKQKGTHMYSKSRMKVFDLRFSRSCINMLHITATHYRYLVLRFAEASSHLISYHTHISWAFLADIIPC